jgi:glycyl-tRNA synthetase beta chain
VCEFTELQGIIGAYYARIQGEDPEICVIIRDQYKPAEELTSLESAIFSFADKMDLISSLFAIGKEPTGSKDPFALRRAAIGILKIILKYDLNIDLANITQKAFDRLNTQVTELNPNTVSKVVAFIIDRLKIVMKENNMRHDVVQAVAASSNNPLEIYRKAEVLNEIVQSAIGEKLISMYKRAKNITQNNTDLSVDESALTIHDEKNLLNAIRKMKNSLNDIEKTNQEIVRKFRSKLEACVAMENIVSSFFDNVLVNADDENVRKNRMNMLSRFITVIDNALPEIEGIA